MRRRRNWLAAGGAIAALSLAAAAMRLPQPADLVTVPAPARDYAEALQRVRRLQALDGADVNPVCRTAILEHGHRTTRAAVFFHGFTNCPRQFERLGVAFHQIGYNVLLPRMPHHGLADRMSSAQARLTAGELAAFVTEMVDIARGLGDHVTVAGLSAGGVLAGWAAQRRSDVDLATIISPAFGVKAIPKAFLRPAVSLALRLPNTFRWWDPEQRLDVAGPVYAYPRLSTRALAQILCLGLALRAEARSQPPAARAILAITNPNDESVDNQAFAQIVDGWRTCGARNLRTYEFDPGLALGHDLIDPDQPDQQIGVVYPILVDLMAGPTK